MSLKNRREFLENSLFATAAALAASSGGTLYAEQPTASKSANEKLSVAIVGVNARGHVHINSFINRPDIEIKYICDVDERVGQLRVDQIIQSNKGHKPKFVKDIRQALEDPSLDIVSIASSNHWHALQAIWSMQAGKDVYLEKPVSHNVLEGRLVVEAARKHKKICQTGTQSRSMKSMREAVALIQGGAIGEVKVARGLCYKPRSPIGKRDKPLEIPKHIDYDLWCGPADKVDLYRNRLHYDWHWDFNTGNGDIGNQGVHQMDIARWGLGLDGISKSVLSYGGRLAWNDAGNTAHTHVAIHDYGDKTIVFEVRGLKTNDYKGAKIGVLFEGSEGYAVFGDFSDCTFFDKDGKPFRTTRGDGDHFGNFLQAVRSRKAEELTADIEEGHKSSALCHTANISYRLGSEVSPDELLERLRSLKTNEDVAATFARTKQHLVENNINLEQTRLTLGPWLKFNPETEKFIDNSQADSLLFRPGRGEFKLPADKSQV